MYSNLICFYAEGSKDLGLGHLSRTIALYQYYREEFKNCSLVFNVDSYAMKWLKRSNIKFSHEIDPKINYETIFIDTTELKSSIGKIIYQAPKRILISPIFNYLELPTHILVRSSFLLEKTKIGRGVEIFEDSNFSLITSQYSKHHISNYSSLIIGICLSGGDQKFPIENLVKMLCKMKEVKKIIIVSDEEQLLFEDKIEFYGKTQNTEELWNLFREINIFIGRQGMLIFEAMHRGIPVISLRAFDEKPKLINSELNDDAYSCIISEDESAIIRFLEDKLYLRKINKDLIERSLQNNQDALYKYSKSIVLE